MSPPDQADRAPETEVAPGTVPFADALRAWAGLGLLSFGGPSGQIALMHRMLVEERRWLDTWLAVHRNPSRLQSERQLSSQPLGVKIFLHGIKRQAKRKPDDAAQLWTSLRDGYALSDVEVATATPPRPAPCPPWTKAFGEPKPGYPSSP